jgi:hypothetical protein
VLLIAVLSTGQTPPTVLAQKDNCPEPNDTFERACDLKGETFDIHSFLDKEGDIDLLHIEPRDFGVSVHAELPESPFPYRLTVLNGWTGEVIAQTSPGGPPSLDAQLGPPGGYYIEVDQFAEGQLSTTAPYHLIAKLTYPGPIPAAKFSAEFHLHLGDRYEDDSVVFNGEPDEGAEYDIEDGRLTINLQNGGTPDKPASGGEWLTDDPLSDFTLVLDVRRSNEAVSGIEVVFRSPDDTDSDTGYHLFYNLAESKLRLAAWDIEKNDRRDLTEWITVAATNPTKANRVVLRNRGRDIWVNVNGGEVAHVQDAKFRKGSIGVWATGWDSTPASLTFGNFLITAP